MVISPTQAGQRFLQNTFSIKKLKGLQSAVIVMVMCYCGCEAAEIRKPTRFWQEAERLLEDKNGAEDPIGHGEGDEHAHHPGQTPAGLGQSGNVGDGVEDPRSSKHPEVKQRT